MASRDPRPPSRSRLSFFFNTALSTMPGQLRQEPESPQLSPPVQTTTLLHSPTDPSPSSFDRASKPRRLGLRKARNLSRVFADFSLLDPFSTRKSVDDLRAPQSKHKPTPLRPATSHGHTHKSSLGGYSMHSLDRKPSLPASPTSLTSPTSPLPSSVPPTQAVTIPISIPRGSIEKTSLSPILLDTPSTPQIIPSMPPSPEDIPLPPSRPGSSRGTILLKKRRRSLDLSQLDNSTPTRTLSSRSRSLRITPISNLTRPATPKTPAAWPELSPDTREPPAPPEAARQRFLEVKRARKMTQLFGQELPQELIRVLDDRANVEHTRRRANSTASSTLDSAPSTPAVERFTDTPEGESGVSPSPPTKPRIDFQERRRRVAKLSQFFGVNHAEIASSLVFAKPDQSRPSSIDDESQTLKPAAYPESTEVGVKVVSRRRWGLGEDMRDVELSDAINKLRCLRAN